MRLLSVVSIIVEASMSVGTSLGIVDGDSVSDIVVDTVDVVDDSIALPVGTSLGIADGEVVGVTDGVRDGICDGNCVPMPMGCNVGM